MKNQTILYLVSITAGLLSFILVKLFETKTQLSEVPNSNIVLFLLGCFVLLLSTVIGFVATKLPGER